ncbi:hypothetical protein QQS21_007086 [Conoideocrella luteorostrata]|uniref:Uncharacterized protein n=1 Tax=Conoideocrella luteorostrata TaxID=1105319 RepID=A0AAJ0FSD8_9HYPO|nr:hypothetical protein QQS21_007086 [Conoideocrella luteorostrata]
MVRLSPPESAPYRWRILRQDLLYLVNKPLSKCNVTECKAILSNIGVGIQAWASHFDQSGGTLARSEEDQKDRNGAETTSRAFHSSCMVDCHHLDNSRLLEGDLFLARTQIEELEMKVKESEQRISNQESQIFQYDLVVDRIAQVLQEYQQSNQGYAPL